jgi:hypothetical protein
MAALSTAQAAMDAHRGVAALAKHGLGFLRSLAVANANKVSWSRWARFGQPCCTFLCPRSHARFCVAVQVPLIAALPAAQAAMDAHRGVAAVAEHGLGFLYNLSVANANKVSWSRWARFGQPWCTLLCRCSHACTPSVPCVHALLCAGAVDGGPAHRPSSHGCPPRSGRRGWPCCANWLLRMRAR